MARSSVLALLTVGLTLACGGVVSVMEPAAPSDAPPAMASPAATHRLLGVVDPERGMVDDIARQGAASTARHEDRMAQKDRDMAAGEARSASSDRQQEIRIDTIRGVEKVEDPTTGERVKVDAGHDAAYRSNPGGDLGSSTILVTDGPIDPSRVDWQGLQRVTLAEY